MTLTPLRFYLILILGVSLIGRLVERRSAGPARRLRFDWTVLLPAVPMLATLILAPWEHSALATQPGLAHLNIGALLFITGVAVRVKGQLEIGANFSTAIEVTEGQSLVTTGLYARIRHPLYLANILMTLCAPVLLDCRLSWIAAALTLAGFIIRIKLEERFLRDNLAGYEDYMKNTSALIPGVF